jgi:hypothetical protein
MRGCGGDCEDTRQKHYLASCDNTRIAHHVADNHLKPFLSSVIGEIEYTTVSGPALLAMLRFQAVCS